MLKIGITGGIGAGKSTVCKTFSSLGIPIYDTDSKAKHITATNSDIKNEIINYFGKDSYTDNIMNRPYIASIVFNNKEKMDILNSIIHPRIEEDFNKWIQENKHCLYIIKESAIMFETNSHLSLDKIIMVSAPIETRIQRVLIRDPQRDRDEVLKVINNQMSEYEKISKSDYVIINNNQSDLLEQVLLLDTIFKDTRL